MHPQLEEYHLFPLILLWCCRLDLGPCARVQRCIRTVSVVRSSPPCSPVVYPTQLVPSSPGSPLARRQPAALQLSSCQPSDLSTEEGDTSRRSSTTALFLYRETAALVNVLQPGEQVLLYNPVIRCEHHHTEGVNPTSICTSPFSSHYRSMHLSIPSRGPCMACSMELGPETIIVVKSDSAVPDSAVKAMPAGVGVMWVGVGGACMVRRPSSSPGLAMKGCLSLSDAQVRLYLLWKGGGGWGDSLA